MEFYKKFPPLLSTVLCDMYNEALSLGQLPPALTNATVTVLLKKDKDPLLCSSYRPISLLNVDYKILAKILALCLRTVLPRIISVDQTGFMLGRHSFHNTRRLLNILTMPSSSTREIVVSLDAEKAFDRVEWEFLFEMMDRFGLGSNKQSALTLFSTSPWHKTRVSTVSFTICDSHWAFGYLATIWKKIWGHFMSRNST